MRHQLVKAETRTRMRVGTFALLGVVAFVLTGCI